MNRAVAPQPKQNGTPKAAGGAQAASKTSGSGQKKPVGDVVLPKNPRARGNMITRAKKDDKPKKAARQMVAARRGARPSGGLPIGKESKGLRFKPPKGTPTGDLINRRLQKVSPWYQSINDPLHGADVKIPDSTGIETGTLQLCQRVFVQAGVVGMAALRVLTLYPCVDGGSPVAAIEYVDAPNANGGPNWAAATQEVFETNAALEAYSDGVRVVSAAIYCQSQASLATNSGDMIGYLEPFPLVNFNPAASLSDYSNHYKTAIIPVNNNQPCVVRWIPIKQNGGQYDMFYSPASELWGPANGYDTNDVPMYEMGVIVNGSVQNATFLFTIVINYEFTPFQNSINILDAKPSPQDAQEVDLVENWTQEMDPVTITSNKIVATPPESSKVEEPGHDTGFGMFFETVKELLPVALEVGAMLL